MRYLILTIVAVQVLAFAYAAFFSHQKFENDTRN